MTAQLEQQPLLTVVQTAQRLNISRRTAYDLIAAGELPAYRVGGALRLSPRAVADWLAKHQTAAKDGVP
jgi:excisionase family DNA binding protein